MDIQRAVSDIVRDIEDRRGLKQVWATLEPEVVAEIESQWSAYVARAAGSSPETPRARAYAAIDQERAFQDEKWGEPAGRHSVAEWVLLLESYVAEAREQVARNPDPHATVQALHTIRKTAAMAVACMEAHGALPRFVRDGSVE